MRRFNMLEMGTSWMTIKSRICPQKKSGECVRDKNCKVRVLESQLEWHQGNPHGESKVSICIQSPKEKPQRDRSHRKIPSSLIPTSLLSSLMSEAIEKENGKANTPPEESGREELQAETQFCSVPYRMGDSSCQLPPAPPPCVYSWIYFLELHIFWQIRQSPNLGSKKLSPVSERTFLFKLLIKPWLPGI